MNLSKKCPTLAAGEVWRTCHRAQCRHHLLPERQTTAINRGDPRPELGDLAVHCALDAARAPLTLEGIGVVLGVSRERVRQIEEGALAKLRGFGLTFEAVIVGAAQGAAEEEAVRLEVMELAAERLKAREERADLEGAALRLRAALKMSGLTHTGLGWHAGVSRTAVGHWVSGASYPRAKTRARAVDVLGCDPWALPGSAPRVTAAPPAKKKPPAPPSADLERVELLDALLKRARCLGE